MLGYKYILNNVSMMHDVALFFGMYKMNASEPLACFFSLHFAYPFPAVVNSWSLLLNSWVHSR